MSNDQKRAETAATILLPPFDPNQLEIVGPYERGSTTNEISALKITINKTDKVSHVGKPPCRPQASSELFTRTWQRDIFSLVKQYASNVASRLYIKRTVTLGSLSGIQRPTFSPFPSRHFPHTGIRRRSISVQIA